MTLSVDAAQTAVNSSIATASGKRLGRAFDLPFVTGSQAFSIIFLS